MSEQKQGCYGTVLIYNLDTEGRPLLTNLLNSSSKGGIQQTGSISRAEYSNAFNINTESTIEGQSVFGKFNAIDNKALFIVGNGTEKNRKNIFTVNLDGTITLGKNGSESMHAVTYQQLNTKFDKVGGTIDGEATFMQNVNIRGNLNVDGIFSVVDTQSLTVKDAIIYTNSDGLDITTTYSGLVIKTGTTTAYGILYDPDDAENGAVKLGLGQCNLNGSFIFTESAGKITTRSNDLNNNNIPYWNGEDFRLHDSGINKSDIITKFNIATNENAGIVKIDPLKGITISDSIVQINPAIESDIVARVSNKPLAPNTLDYSVKSALTNLNYTYTESEQNAVKTLFNIHDIKIITDTTIFIWGTEPGIYYLPANIKIYYNGTSTSPYISEAYVTGNTYLIIAQQTSNIKTWFLLSGRGGKRYLLNGYTTISTGIQDMIDVDCINLIDQAQTISALKTFSAGINITGWNIKQNTTDNSLEFVYGS